MDIEEMKVYIKTLEEENEIFRKRNEELYKQNCFQAQMLSRHMRDGWAYSYNVQIGNFEATSKVYNTLMANTASTSLHSINVTFI